MADPARHKVQHARALRDHVPIARRQRRDRALVDVRDEPRRRVEGEIVTCVLLRERADREFGDRISGHTSFPIRDDPAADASSVANVVGRKLRASTPTSNWRGMGLSLPWL